MSLRCHSKPRRIPRVSTVCARAIAPFALFGQQFKEQLDRLVLVVEHVDLLLAAATDAAPASQKRRLSEQVGRIDSA
jgi:hypothetical protein